MFPKTDDIQKCFVLSVPVYGRAFFFHEAYLPRIHAVTTKKWTERRDARAKLSFSLQKPIAFFVILVAAASRSRCRRWKGDLLCRENVSP